MCTDDDDPFNGLEKEGLQYVVGYVAHKFSKKYPQLVDSEEQIDHENWIKYQSKGRLTYPSPQLVKVAKIMENLFVDFHGNRLSKVDGIMKKLTKSLMEKIKPLCINLPMEVIQCLVRTRTFIRLNNLNQILFNKKNNRTNKNKLKTFTG